MKLFKQERLGILEGLLFAVGDEGVSLEQLEYVIDVNEVEVKSLILDLKIVISRFAAGLILLKLRVFIK